MKQFVAGQSALAVLLLGVALVVANPLGVENNGGQRPLIGGSRCTWGPSYWCGNLTTAKGCNAVRHCIQTVWETKEVPVKDDSICKICKDMVTQARDQLLSNETQEELKEVFEGSCNLIPIKPIKKECDNLADNFIPELVEMLASQMNPDQVCTVAGLCNNVEILKTQMRYYQGALDGSLEEKTDVHTDAPVTVPTTNAKPLLSCGNCNSLSTIVLNKFHAKDRDEILEDILRMCRGMSSYTDACAAMAITYFDDLYEFLNGNLQPEGICHLSGACSSKYHQHPEDVKSESAVEITNLGALVEAGDDVPCQLCEQLVQHLRDVLVANTTEEEFKTVLQGICKQTKGFQDECLSLVDQYYRQIYETLVNNLDANGACFLIGVCPKGKPTWYSSTARIAPLVPVIFPENTVQVSIRKKLGSHEPKFTQEQLHNMQLPIDKLMGAANPTLLVQNGQLCTLCEYLLHFIQETLSTPATDDEIKKTVEGVCKKIPNIRKNCDNFVDMYGDAVIALLVQGLDPRTICPMMQMCPKDANNNDMEVFAPNAIDKETEKPTCPLCLFAVEEAQQRIKNDKSKSNIKNVLDKLCVHLPKELKEECVDFVQTYSSELIDMLITDFTPTEICADLKLCEKSNNYLSEMGISAESDEVNEIDNSAELPTVIAFGQDPAGKPDCLLCEEVVKVVEKKMGKNPTKEQIKSDLELACLKLKKPWQPKCHRYMDKYADKIADLILQEMKPKVICTELGLCLGSEQEDLEIDEALKYDVVVKPNEKSEAISTSTAIVLHQSPTCVLCELVMAKLEQLLPHLTDMKQIEHALKTICPILPKTVQQDCNTYIDEYAPAMLQLLKDLAPAIVCKAMPVCLPLQPLKVVRDEVIECGICHGVTTALLPYFEEHANRTTILQQEMIDVACEYLPAQYNEICSEMIQIYGPSILNLYNKNNSDVPQICSKIGKCFKNENSQLAYAKMFA